MRPRRHGETSAASAARRDHMAARGSDRFVEVVEEMLAELPARVRGGRAKLSEQALGVVRVVVDELNLVTRDEVDELELRVAQLRAPAPPARAAGRPTGAVARRPRGAHSAASGSSPSTARRIGWSRSPGADVTTSNHASHREHRRRRRRGRHEPTRAPAMLSRSSRRTRRRARCRSRPRRRRNGGRPAVPAGRRRARASTGRGSPP